MRSGGHPRAERASSDDEPCAGEGGIWCRAPQRDQRRVTTCSEFLRLLLLLLLSRFVRLELGLGRVLSESTLDALCNGAYSASHLARLMIAVGEHGNSMVSGVGWLSRALAGVSGGHTARSLGCFGVCLSAEVCKVSTNLIVILSLGNPFPAVITRTCDGQVRSLKM